MAHKQRANKSYDLSITKVYCSVIVFCKIVYCILTMVYNTVQELTRPMIYVYYSPTIHRSMQFYKLNLFTCHQQPTWPRVHQTQPEAEY